MHSVYEFKDYRTFVRAVLDSEAFGRGARSQLAEFLGVRSSFISYVLSGSQDFSLEHALRMSEFLKLNRQEREFFMLLVQREKAGSHDLKKFFESQIDEKRAVQKEVKRHVKRETKTLSEADLQEYFSAWFHPVIHMMIRNPKFQEPRLISDALGLELQTVRGAFELLERLGFIRRTKTGWVDLQQSFHIGERSTALRIHHLNWRTEAQRALAREERNDLHYTAVMSLDRESSEEIRSILLKSIQDLDPKIRDAKDESVYAFTMDLFRVS